MEGPLVMFPPAEDNYGSDACSILSLPGDPTVLVIATVDGRIYHSIVLNTEKSPDKVHVYTCKENGEIYIFMSLAVVDRWDILFPGCPSIHLSSPTIQF